MTEGNPSAGYKALAQEARAGMANFAYGPGQGMVDRLTTALEEAAREIDHLIKVQADVLDLNAELGEQVRHGG